MVIIAGMDEAGRGPMLGPIVFAIVVVNEQQNLFLEKNGINDSKQLTKKKREILYDIIVENCEFYFIMDIKAKDIDFQRSTGLTLNQIEVNAFQKILKKYKGKLDKLYIDAADVNENRFGLNFKDLTSANIISEHKADSMYCVVGAASILAKVTRDRFVDEIQYEMNQFDPELPKVGSGYPNNITKNFVREYYRKYNKLAPCVRKSWKSSINILNEFKGPEQASLDDF